MCVADTPTHEPTYMEHTYQAPPTRILTQREEAMATDGVVANLDCGIELRPRKQPLEKLTNLQTAFTDIYVFCFLNLILH
jgi:hypothetical protein